jgi:predicted RecB family nuclease
MQLVGTDDFLLSATDLAHYSGCAQRTWLDRLKALGLATPDHFDDPRLDLLRQRGYEHERALLEGFEREGKRVVRFDQPGKEERNPEGYARRAAETLEAMRAGPDVIYQGTLYDGRWLGFPDFLMRDERPSDLGAWSYEVADAKLAREAKAAGGAPDVRLLAMLARVQCAEPERIHLYLGGPEPRKESFRLAHFAAYQRSLERRLADHLAAAPDELPLAPEPVEHCQICDWRSRCKRERTEVDHLSLVAGIARDQRKALTQAGVHTLEGLATLPLDAPPDGLRAASFQRIREQARVQLEGRRRGAPYHEALPLEPNGDGPPLGLAALPAPHEQDWFFDLEGADYAYEHGLEYLWGVSFISADTADGFRSAWALTPDEEKTALERFLEQAEAHVTAHPGAHIYHYGHYEPTALKRLVGRYGTGTDALDRLLQRQVFVDLHRIVKQGVRASVESYSIKKLEPHYGFGGASRSTTRGPRAAGSSTRWRRGSSTRSSSPRTVRWSRDTTATTASPRGRSATGSRGSGRRWRPTEGEEIPRPKPPEPKEDKDKDVAAEVAELMDRLLQGVPAETHLRTPEQHIRWLAAHLLEWHRREDKSAWWEYFHLRDLTVDELIEETKPLAGLEYVGPVGTEDRSTIHRFRFPDQDHRLSEGKDATDAQTEKTRKVVKIDEGNRTIDLKVGNTTKWEPEALRALLPEEIVRATDLRARLRKTAHRLLEGEDALAAWSPASLVLLCAEPPRFRIDGSSAPAPLTDVAPTAGLLERAVEATLRLQDGVLPVQGPPGTGKTYSGARMIRALLREGCRVGVTGPSHKVITNLLDAVCEADENDEPTSIVGLQVTEDGGCEDQRFTQVAKGREASRRWRRSAPRRASPRSTCTPAPRGSGPARTWSAPSTCCSSTRPASSRSPTRSPSRPPRPSSSCSATPSSSTSPRRASTRPAPRRPCSSTWPARTASSTPTRDSSWARRGGCAPRSPRSPPSCSTRASSSRARTSRPSGSRSPTEPQLQGLVLEEVPHEGNDRESEEEAARVVEVFRRLLAGGATFTNRKGETRPLALDDILVVAPYNAQVERIRKALAEAGFEDARVGTVDKFQGQEAAVAIYSLASSSAEDAPRGMEFLYALDRLNVATSRARVVTVVVASPALLVADCKRPKHMRMVNAVVRYGEMAGEVGSIQPYRLKNGSLRYEVEIAHHGLRRHRIIKGDDRHVVHRKAVMQIEDWEEKWAAQQKKEKARRAAAASLADADERTREATALLRRIENTLLETLQVDDAIDFDGLINERAYAEPEPARPRPDAEPHRDRPAFRPLLNVLDHLLPPLKRKKKQEAEERFRLAHRQWAEQSQQLAELHQQELQEWRRRKAAYEREQAEENARVEVFRTRYMAREPAAIEEYCDLVLSNSDYPDFMPQEYDLAFNGDTGVLVVDYLLPAPEDVPTLKEVRFVKSRGEVSEKHLSERERDKLYDLLLYQVALRTIHELYEADQVEVLTSIVFNGRVNSVDKATGHFLWGVADLIRDTFKRGKYQDVILPLTVLRRSTACWPHEGEGARRGRPSYKGKKLENLDPQLRKDRGFAFYNTSRYDFEKLLADAPHLAANLRNYIAGFSPNMREVLEKFDFDNTISKLDEAGLLFQVLERFKNVDLHPDRSTTPRWGRSSRS